MKSLGLLASAISDQRQRRNLRVVVRLLVLLVVLTVAYAAVFHQLMALEDREFSWTTSFYWVLTVMSTLGFGDITFEGDAGRAFSMLVLATGAVFILVLLPFAVIKFVVDPWMDARERSRAPRELDDRTAGHIIITQLDAMTDALIDHARAASIPYVVLVDDVDEALRLHDRGYAVMRGELDDPSTYVEARAAQAALLVTTRSDAANTNVAFTVRGVDEDVPIVATATAAASVDVLELAGCDRVLQMGQLLGEAMARRVLGRDRRAHVIGSFGVILIAEATVAGTDMVGRALAEVDMRRCAGVNVIGVWGGGTFRRPTPDEELAEADVLILAGTEEQLDAYDRIHAADDPYDLSVLVLGGGRVGRAAATALAERGIAATVVEQDPDRPRVDGGRYVIGDAADLEVLREAGIDDVGAVLITSHEDDRNVFLTIYCRRLREDLQIIARATRDRNTATLHRAGADAVLGYASLGAIRMWNVMGDDDRLLVVEGVQLFQTPVPPGLAGRSLADADVGAETGCTVVAIEEGGQVRATPDPETPLPADADLVVIADDESEARFRERYPAR